MVLHSGLVVCGPLPRNTRSDGSHGLSVFNQAQVGIQDADACGVADADIIPAELEVRSAYIQKQERFLPGYPVEKASRGQPG